MPPFMLLNLNRERMVTSATELPSWESQNTLLYTKRVFEDANVGGMALSFDG
jgi:hypothetical protein